MALARIDHKSKSRIPTGQADEVIISDSSFIQRHRAFERSQAGHSKKRKREDRGDSSVVYGEGSYKGPWARYEERRPDVSGSDEEGVEVEEEDEDEEVEVVYEDEGAIAPQPKAPVSKAGTAYEDTGDGAETTEFHGSEMYDYQGRTYMHVPQDLGHIDLRKHLELDERKSFVPKKIIHSWKVPGSSAISSQQRPVTQTRFFPEYGHLLLSSYADAKIRIWDVYHNRELLRTYSGHTKAITDIDFTPPGTSFFSGAYDRKIKQWDTETGAILTRYSPGATPHVIRVNPTSPSEFLVGLSDKRILQYDTRIADPKPTQDYNYHLGAVNTITFCDASRRFMTTSDDRSLRAWEYGIPVPIKLVQEPEMFAMTRSCAHPNGKHVLYQSADNQIVVYDTAKFRQHKKKSFRGHNTAGYSADVTCSPDGAIVASTDSQGWVCFWDYKTSKMYSKIMASQGSAATCVAWHPKEASRVVVAGLDGVIRYFD